MHEDSDMSLKTDMHLHTIASDGTWSPEELVGKLLENDINIFSVTDHDTTGNIGKVKLLAEDAGLKFIPGVEINATLNSLNYHILGYGIDCSCKELQALLEENRLLLEEKDDESVVYLEKKGFNVSYPEFKSYSNNHARGGWKALNYLIDKNICTNHEEYFSLLSEWGNPFVMLTFASPEKVVGVIEAAGGFPVLAHPGADFYGNDYKYVVDQMLGYGIKGIECFHPENNLKVMDFCLKTCKSRNLLITGGSDCHGDFVKSRRIGLPDVRIDQLNLGRLA